MCISLKISTQLAAILLFASSVAQASQPNIILIFMDDLGYNDIGAQTYPSKTDYYPNSGPGPQPNNSGVIPAPNKARLLTPAIDSLASDGLQMNSFHTARLCSPSRASLLTGRYAARQSINGVFFPTSNDGFSTREVTLPEQLRELGYSTAMIGKWHLGYNPSQTLSFQMMPTRHGFQEFYGTPYSNDMSSYHLIEDETILQANLGTGEGNQTKLTWQFTERALDYIERNTGEDKPFFLYFAHAMTHIPCWPSNQEFQNADGTTWPLFKGSSGVSYYYDVVKEVDHSVARILAKLDDLGIAEDTLVIFTSDNGPWLKLGSKNLLDRSVGSAYPLKDGKFTTWEGGIRVPFLARWSGQIPAGTVSDEVGGLVDLLPTLVSLGGGSASSDRTIDGIDLWPHWSGAVSSLDREYAMFYDGVAQGVRKGQWKLRSGALYDLENDIQELSDVSAVSANASVLAELQTYKSTLETSLTPKEPKGTYTSYEIEFSENDIAVPEGGTATVDIRLSHNPGSTVAVSLVHFSGDTDLSISSGSSLSFTTSNWSDWQTVTLAAGADADALRGGATFRATMAAHSVVRELFAYEADDDALAPATSSLVWPKVDSVTLQTGSDKLLAEGSLMVGGVNSPVGSTFHWVKVSGPEAVTFTNPDTARTGVSFASNGVYKLRLYADHPTAASFDSTDFSVNVGGGTTTTTAYKYAPTLAYNASADTNGNTTWENVLSPGTRDWALANSVTLTASDPAAQLTFIDAAWSFTGNATLPSGATSSDFDSYSNGSASFELWFKPTTLPVSTPQVLWETGGDVGASFILDGNQIQFVVDDGGSDAQNGALAEGTLAPAAAQDGFIHCVGVIDLTSHQIKLYLDGSLVDTETIATVADWCGVSQTGLGTIVDSDGDETSESNALGGNDLLGLSFAPFAGQIAHILFYNKALLTAEVADLTAGPKELLVSALNIAPAVSAGNDQSVAYTAGAALVGSASDDGLPGSSSLTLGWSLYEGPAIPTFTDETSLSTEASFTLPGVHQIWLEVDDGEVKVFDHTQITVAAYSYSEWKSGITFPASEDSATDNPDGDPWNNGWEWLFGSDPLTYNSSQTHSNSITSDDAQTVTFVFEFIVPRNREPNLFLQATESLSLGWNDLGELLPTIEVIDGTTERWTFNLQVDTSDAAKYFVRSAIGL